MVPPFTGQTCDAVARIGRRGLTSWKGRSPGAAPEAEKRNVAISRPRLKIEEDWEKGAGDELGVLGRLIGDSMFMGSREPLLWYPSRLSVFTEKIHRKRSVDAQYYCAIYCTIFIPDQDWIFPQRRNSSEWCRCRRGCSPTALRSRRRGEGATAAREPLVGHPCLSGL